MAKTVTLLAKAMLGEEEDVLLEAGLPPVLRTVGEEVAFAIARIALREAVEVIPWISMQIKALVDGEAGRAAVLREALWHLHYAPDDAAPYSVRDAAYGAVFWALIHVSGDGAAADLAAYYAAQTALYAAQYLGQDAEAAEARAREEIGRVLEESSV